MIRTTWGGKGRNADVAGGWISIREGNGVKKVSAHSLRACSRQDSGSPTRVKPQHWESGR